jgi:hypothetical protein
MVFATAVYRSTEPMPSFSCELSLFFGFDGDHSFYEFVLVPLVLIEFGEVRLENWNALHRGRSCFFVFLI